MKKIHRKIQKSKESGGILVTSMIFIVLSGLTVTSAITLSRYLDQSLDHLRIVELMNRMEANLRVKVNQTGAFEGCELENTDSCELVTSYLEPLELNFKTTDCPPGRNPCGIRVEDLQLSGNSVKAKIVYEGTDVAIAPRSLDMTIAGDVLQPSENENRCLTGFFQGYDHNGNIICRRPLRCQGGNHLYMGGLKNLSVAYCADLPEETITGDKPLSYVVVYTAGYPHGLRDSDVDFDGFAEIAGLAVKVNATIDGNPVSNFHLNALLNTPGSPGGLSFAEHEVQGVEFQTMVYSESVED